MKTPGLPLILLAAISMVSMSCNHHEKMIRDTKKVFAEQEKIEISPSTIEALGRLKSLIFDNIDNLIPLEEKAVLYTHEHKDGAIDTLSYKNVDGCREIKPSGLKTFLEVLPEEALKNYESDVSEFGTVFGAMKVCNFSSGRAPSLEIFLFAKSIKGNYSCHYIDHRIGVNMKWRSDNEIKNIESGLVKLDTLAEGIVYRISVSPDIGMLD